MFQLTEDARRDIQGVITTGYGHLSDAAYLFLKIGRTSSARQWLHGLIPQVRTAESWRPEPGAPKVKPRVALNIALTFDGYRELGLPEPALNSFSREFIFGMAERAEVLGDSGDSAPEHWEFGSPQNELHAVLMLFGEDQPTLDQFVGTQKELIESSHGLEILSEQRGHRFTPAQEHFGFEDGVSQPEIEGVKKRPDPGQTLIPTGEVILGYPNAYDCLPPSIGVPREDDRAGILPPFPEQPGWKDLGRHGTYLVFRKLEQDVAGFWRFIQANIEAVPEGIGAKGRASKEEAMLYLGAKFVGRWRSGAPLILAPYEDDPALGADDERNNDFLFTTSDPQGLVCPLGAHIRRANPRDSLAKDTSEQSLETANRHRVVRRGIPYGDRLVTTHVLDIQDDGKPRGLYFLALCSSIKRQFEFVQQEWVDNPRFGGLFDDRDPLVGSNDGSGHMTLQRQVVRRTIPNVPRFVKTMGGGYFFMPSITALRFLAER